MMELSGTIVFPCEIIDDDDRVVHLGSDILEVVLEHLEHSVSVVGHVLQNATYGVYLFDFSNHLGGQFDAVTKLMKDLEVYGPEVSARITIKDGETETDENLELNWPLNPEVL